MKNKGFSYLKIVVIAVFSMTININVFSQVIDTNKINPQPKLITLHLDSSDYQSIFQGAPETVSFHSGLVTLKFGESVGHHNTDEYEEIIVIFSGEGQMTFTNGEIFKLKYGEIAYCPPHTEHDVKNTGSTLLKYLYIAADTKH